MGIQGLLKVFSSIQRDHHLSNYEGQRVAIDTYCWIHKAIYIKANEILTKSDISAFIPYVISQIDLLLSYKIHPIMVFDGGKLLSKAEEENSRESTRIQKHAKALELLNAGDHEAAYRKFAESVDVSPDLAHLLLKKIKQKYGSHVICIVSPYEADAQLAYLSRIGFVDAIITEDSDLLCFGAKKILYKLNNKGYVKEILLSDWQKCQDFDFKDWSFDLFLSLCIISGCDYLDSLKNIGFKTAYKALKDVKSVETLFKKWRMNPKIGFSAEYEEKFYKAFLTFKFQRVFCPISRTMVNVNELCVEKFEETLKNSKNISSLGKILQNPEKLSPITLKKLKDFYEKDQNLEFLGKKIEDSEVCAIADGAINPITLKPYDENYSLNFGEETENFLNKNSKNPKEFNLISHEEKENCFFKGNFNFEVKKQTKSLFQKEEYSKPGNYCKGASNDFAKQNIQNTFANGHKNNTNFNNIHNNRSKIFDGNSLIMENKDADNYEENNNRKVIILQKKSFQTDISKYFIRNTKETMQIEQPFTHNDSDFSLHSKPKTIINENKIRLNTPEMIDKNKLKELLMRNPLKRGKEYLEETEMNHRLPQKKIIAEEKILENNKLWDVEENFNGDSLGVENIIQEFRVQKAHQSNENNEDNAVYKQQNLRLFDLCNNLFKPLF